jgi:hypothetical protein
MINMPTYTFACDFPDCKEAKEVECKMSQKRLNWPICPEHGDMRYIYNNTNKHVDNTTTRKGYHNSDEEGYRNKGKK